VVCYVSHEKKLSKRHRQALIEFTKWTSRGGGVDYRSTGNCVRRSVGTVYLVSEGLTRAWAGTFLR